MRWRELGCRKRNRQDSIRSDAEYGIAITASDFLFLCTGRDIGVDRIDSSAEQGIFIRKVLTAPLGIGLSYG